MSLRGKHNNQINSRRAREALGGGLYEDSPSDFKTDRRLYQKQKATETDLPERRLSLLDNFRLEAKLKKKKVNNT